MDTTDTALPDAAAPDTPVPDAPAPEVAAAPLLLRGFAPLAVAIVLGILMVLLVPSIAPERVVVQPGSPGSAAATTVVPTSAPTTPTTTATTAVVP